MRAFVVTGPGTYEVQDLQKPIAAPGEVVVDVERVGVCGTDVELFTGEMAYLHQGLAAHPLRPGHEWSGRVVSVGPGVDAGWLGRRVTGDTMLGCGTCHRCTHSRQHLCEQRDELGVRGPRPGALAEQVSVPATSLHTLPASIDATLGALVEPGGNALRAAQAAVRDRGERVLVLGPGTIGLLTAMFARSLGAEVHLVGETQSSLDFAGSLGFEHLWRHAAVPDLPFEAVVDASNATPLPALALDLVEPGGRVVYIGLAPEPSRIDTRTLALKDVTAVGVLSASPALDATIAAYADRSVDPRSLVGATVGLEQIGPVLVGERPAGAGAGPKIHVDPRLIER
ncbi:zinc-dependent alcohol dehydrogenase [Streptomyces sp. BH097]|uniref:zinc-dependent alcohol dehydrogenase n=1 Tax=unclassified Streptomyces TaxID=2593676 RepID=UPI003BB50824